jgi:hypothetical protein
MSFCVYMEEDTDKQNCFKYGNILTKDGDKIKHRCDTCSKRLLINDPKFTESWEDPLHITDRFKVKTDGIRNILAGHSAFLIGGGPSANNLPLEQLNERGIFSMGVNNVAGHPRFIPQAFVCSDPPLKFSHSIWLDPKIMKFIPFPKLRGGRSKLRRKVDGKFIKFDKYTHQCPNVWGFKRQSWLKPDDSFFLTDGACWGNHKSGVARTGEPKTVNTMFLGLRLVAYLGCSRLFLVGVDFHMGDGYGYSFDQERDEGACQSNNSQFIIANQWLCKMQQAGVFERFGMSVYNCFERSGLRAFPYVPFEEALEDCRGLVERGELDLKDYYTKGQEDKSDEPKG